MEGGVLMADFRFIPDPEEGEISSPDCEDTTILNESDTDCPACEEA